MQSVSLTPFSFVRIAAGVLACVLPGKAIAEERVPDFALEVRPILSDRCFGCHGPGDQHADLRLDTFEGATDWAIIPGDAEESEVIARVLLADDDELRMPPIHSGKDRLTEAEVATLRRWIEAGAEYEQHWAFTSVERPEPPKAVEAPTEIDRFVAERLASEGLEFRPEADKRTLLRRAAFDLTGLPPSREVAEAFLADDQPGAYGRLVDRLLASPRYGEHMGRYWLDAVRYGDTHGKHLDNYREMWPYRDWVLRAFNNNKPYDEFLIEQLAGDLLPDAGTEELIASGYNRCNVTTAEGGVIEKEIYTDNVRDRTDTFGTVVLGLTVACAKCHDHKYDPITQKDYYSLFAFFNSLDGGPNDGNEKDHAPAMRLPTPEQSSRMAELDAERQELVSQLMREDEAMTAAQDAWEKTLAGLANPDVAKMALAGPRVLASDWLWVGPFPKQGRTLNWYSPPAEKDKFNREQKFPLRDGRFVGWQPRPEWIDGVTHYALPGKEGHNVLRRTLYVDEPTEIEIGLGTDDMVRVHLNGEQIHKTEKRRAVEAKQDRLKLELKAGENVLVLCIGNVAEGSGFRFDFLDGAAVLSAEALELAAVPAQERDEDQQRQLLERYRWRSQAFPELIELRNKIATAESMRDKVSQVVTTTLIYKERKKPRDAFILNRGEYDNEGEKVSRATPGFLPPMAEGLPLDRLGLARWAVSPENPLAARVAVNRFWQQVFGVGLVKTSDDFGSQSSPPSHRGLLDWLAADFIESGWDIKGLMRQIVMTRTYRQSSAAPADSWAGDPANRLLSRGPRFRLDAEALRDQALAISGLLVEQVGGAPVRPPQPDGLWAAVAYTNSNTDKFVADTDPQKIHRRSLYSFHKRTSPPPQLTVLDGPTRESCSVRRERTNTPLQALLLLNDPQYIGAARALAENVLEEATDDAGRAAALIERCTGRPALDAEVAEIVAAVKDERDRYAAATEDAEALLGVGSGPRDEQHDAAEAAAWTVMANLVLNLDEVVTKN